MVQAKQGMRISRQLFPGAPNQERTDNREDCSGAIEAETPDIVVIGGIKIHNASNTGTKTPGLGDVPLVGNLFKGKTQKNKLEEMLIFLSPIVID